MQDTPDDIHNGRDLASFTSVSFLSISFPFISFPFFSFRRKEKEERRKRRLWKDTTKKKKKGKVIGPVYIDIDIDCLSIIRSVP